MTKGRKKEFLRMERVAARNISPLWNGDLSQKTKIITIRRLMSK
jgi:hypothetical protein